MKALALASALALIAVSPPAFGQPRSITLSERTWSPEGSWPFTSRTVIVRCRYPAGPRQGSVTVQPPGGREYALNGIAKTRYPDFSPIWRPHPLPELASRGVKAPVGDAIKAGLSLCG